MLSLVLEKAVEATSASMYFYFTVRYGVTQDYCCNRIYVIYL